jgi:TonB-dependent starch-binding outer membrane protein SusC
MIFSDRFTISTGSNYINSQTNRSFTGNENEGGLSYGYNLAFYPPLGKSVSGRIWRLSH